MIEIYAGENAHKTILENGFSASMFNSFLGASGGPKWFTLFGLDQYVFGEFFKGRQQPLNIIGSSAGAFRAACFAQNDPVAAIKRLAYRYADTVYSDDAKPAEITQKGRELLDYVYGDNGTTEIINNPIFRAHFIVAKSNGLVASERKALQLLGLTGSYLRNKISRPLLKAQYERFIFQPKSSTLDIQDPDNIPTTIIHLTEANIKDALMASGSIPMVMEGIPDISGCPSGMYRDGGIIDYHFDFDINNDGLTLYPHFSSTIKAGWFDKSSSRKVRAQHYKNTVLICPTQQFINSLPHNKIPDRTDFTKMSSQARINYWYQVLEASERLGEAFRTFVDNQSIEMIKPISLLTD
ncbi:patatin-like phospholipase family protein [Thalassotalea atypica]|uniref:patatin-like phospholipase family protein n=1 Tax=Thalassotalea atypica TaxID=2054316 RepID=UPI002573B461|nr:patatin-like phospholipase family protein [Thalassotalea atypica]